MKKFMLVGAVSAGKTSLMQAIYGQDLSYQKTQAIDFKDNIIDTPGEYLEQRFRYRSLGITAADTDLIVLVQSCTDLRCVFAPGLSIMFAKPMVGVVTKIDLAKSPTDIARAKKNLQLAGCKTIFTISSKDKTGIPAFQSFIGMEPNLQSPQNE